MSGVASEMPAVELDARGLVCPSSLLMALRELNRHKVSIRSGEMVLVILTDNPDSTNRIAETAINMGYKIEVCNIGNGFKMVVSKTSSSREDLL